MDILMSRVPNIEKNKRGAYMSMSNSFKVKFIRDDSYGFKKITFTMQSNVKAGWVRRR